MPQTHLTLEGGLTGAFVERKGPVFIRGIGLSRRLRTSDTKKAGLDEARFLD